ncbi:hypothetical protein KJ853_02975 [Patescibacteria group bacterium]|nr:hypothetical protein [Patescibacteria group bacterium]
MATATKKIILVIGEDLEEAREKMEVIYEIVKRKNPNFCVLPEIISHQTTIARCRNLAPIAIFITRRIIFKNGFKNITKEILGACSQTAKVFLFDANGELNRIICEELLTK